VDEKALTTVYGVVGSALFVFSINLFWLQDTGNFLLKAIIPHSKTPSAVLIGTFGITLVGLFLLIITQSYWTERKSAPWYSRLPPAFVEPSRPNEPLAIVIRLIGFAGFIIVPTYLAAHFLLYLGPIGVIDRRSEVNGLDFWSITSAFLRPGTWSGDNRFRIDDVDGASFFPTLEPLLLSCLVVGLIVWAAYQTIRFIWTAAHRQSQQVNDW
jgi:hypothetical protein